MDPRDPVVLQGLAATGGAMLLVLGLGWWLYLSPVRRPVAPVPTPPVLAAGIAIALGIAGIELLAGGLWDASQHIRTGRIVGGSDFLWPSHIVLYGSFLLSLATAGVAMGRMSGAARAAGMDDPRLWFRRQPLLGVVALASAYELLALPGDALWHQIFGIDLTAWSPPHLTIALMMGIVLVGAAAVLVDARRAAGATRPAIAAMVLLGLALNALYLVGVLEWELPVPMSPHVAARGMWSYPAVSGVLAFAVLALARVLAGTRWAATGTALAFCALRLAVTIGLAVTGQVVPAFPIVPLLGALALDATAARSRSALLAAAAFTAGYAAVALPQLALRTDLPALTVAERAIAVAAIFAGSLAILALMRAARASRPLGATTVLVRGSRATAQGTSETSETY